MTNSLVVIGIVIGIFATIAAGLLIAVWIISGLYDKD